MKHFNRHVAATIAAVVMTFTATAPANAVFDSNGRLVAVIIDSDGEVYY